MSTEEEKKIRDAYVAGLIDAESLIWFERVPRHVVNSLHSDILNAQAETFAQIRMRIASALEGLDEGNDNRRSELRSALLETGVTAHEFVRCPPLKPKPASAPPPAANAKGWRA